jgi:hypothetical protein
MRKKLSQFQMLSDLCWSAGTFVTFYVGVTFELSNKPLSTFAASVLTAWFFGAALSLDRIESPHALKTACRRLWKMTLLLALLTGVASPLFWRSIPVLGALPAWWGHWMGAALVFAIVGLILITDKPPGATGMRLMMLMAGFGLVDAAMGIARALL